MIRRLAFLGLWLVFSPALANAGSLYARNLQCDPRFTQRELEICKALERELEWEWTGHGIISPSYRTTSEGARRIFCTLPITVRDTRPLVLIAVAVDRHLSGEFADSQLSNGARSLLHLLGQQALDAFPGRERLWDERAWQLAKNLRAEIALGVSDPGLIWHPQNPHYILRGGCKQSPSHHG